MDWARLAGVTGSDWQARGFHVLAAMLPYHDNPATAQSPPEPAMTHAAILEAVSRSKLAVELNKGGKKAPKGTARNWNTVLKLADLGSR